MGKAEASGLPPCATSANNPAEGECPWHCRTCCARDETAYRYPPSPRAYCAECGAALDPLEQEIAFKRLALDSGDTRVRRGYREFLIPFPGGGWFLRAGEGGAYPPLRGRHPPAAIP